MTKATTDSLSLTKWNCKYHLAFAPKFRRQEIYGKIKLDIGKILRTLCEQKSVEILEAEACPDHIHIVGKYSAAFERVTIRWISKRQKFSDDL